MSALPVETNAQRNSRDAIRGAVENAVAVLDVPEPLRRPLPPSAPYPIDALGTVLGAAAASIHRIVQSPAALGAQSVLAAAALAAQPHADVEIDGRRYPLSLMLVSTAESGERKSASDDLAVKAHREFERQSFEEYGAEKAEHQVAIQSHKSATDAVMKEKAKNEADMRRALAALGPPPEAPLVRNLIVSEPTLEGLQRLWKEGTGNIGLLTDEGGMFLGGHAMGKEHAAKTAAGLCTAWGRGEQDRVRSGDGAAKLYGVRFTMHLMLQPVLAEKAFSDPLLVGQGFLPRCLMVWPESVAGQRNYIETNPAEDLALVRYGHRMSDLLRKPVNHRQGTRNQLDPRAISLAPDAKALWITAHDAIERRQGPGREYAGIKGWASKAAEQILRIAGVLALASDPDAGAVKRADIDAAATLVDFYLGEAARMVGTAETHPDILAAESLLHWAWSTGRTVMSSNDALRLGPNCIRDRMKFNRAMQLLEETRWAFKIPEGLVIDGGHRRNVWHVRGPV